MRAVVTAGLITENRVDIIEKKLGQSHMLDAADQLAITVGGGGISGDPRRQHPARANVVIDKDWASAKLAADDR